MSGAQDIVIAAGVESMTRVPMGLVTNGLPRKNGLGFYMSESLMDKYEVEFSQFLGAEMMAKKYDLSQDDLTAYSVESHRRAAQATAGNPSSSSSSSLPPFHRLFHSASLHTCCSTELTHVVETLILFSVIHQTDCSPMRFYRYRRGPTTPRMALWCCWTSCTRWMRASAVEPPST